jgi:hypothetical protein
MQTSGSDLDAALAFVIAQIDEEGVRSSAPLDDQERFLLTHLPTRPTSPAAYPDLDPEWPTPALCDLPYEQLCRLAKNARLHDIQTRPGAAREWEYASAVLELNRHPMAWLLDWAGMKKRRPRWDSLMLVGTAVLFVLLFVLGAIGLSLVIEGRSELWRRSAIAAGGCIYIAGDRLLILFHAATRGIANKEHDREVPAWYAVNKSAPDPFISGSEGNLVDFFTRVNQK